MSATSDIIPAVIKYKTWEREFDDHSNVDIIEGEEQVWELNLRKIREVKDRDNPNSGKWIASYLLWGYEGVEDQLPKSMSLKEVKDLDDNFEALHSFIGTYMDDYDTPKRIKHGIIANTPEEALELLLKWVYEEGLL